MILHQLELALDPTLFIPGWQHATFITLTSIPAATSQAGGQGLHIGYGVYSTPFGPCMIATTSQGVCHVSFVDGPLHADHAEVTTKHLQTEWPHAEMTYDPTNVEAVGDRLFHPPSHPQPPLTLHVKGTKFQMQVWRSLLQIPFAATTTYQQLANSMGKPTAARAIGNAVGRNPIAYLIPCHRVIRQSGALGGYRWGLDRKIQLLNWEASASVTA
ncbi:MAG: methylated-DNA--[protein]-cysteine S-methyltransferase [Leptolyngbyaceae cyanobacterium]